MENNDLINNKWYHKAQSMFIRYLGWPVTKFRAATVKRGCGELPDWKSERRPTTGRW